MELKQVMVIQLTWRCIMVRRNTNIELQALTLKIGISTAVVGSVELMSLSVRCHKTQMAKQGSYLYWMVLGCNTSSRTCGNITQFERLR